MLKMKIGTIITSKEATYKVSGEKTVKKVSTTELLKSIVEEDETKFLNSLFSFLKDQDESTSRKREKVLLRGFLLGFKDGSFKIWDSFNFNKERLDWKIKLPTPEEVWEFIKRPKLLKSELEAEKEFDAKQLKKKLLAIKKYRREKQPTKAEALQKEIEDYLDREKALKEKEAKKLAAKKEAEKLKSMPKVPTPPVDLEACRKKAVNIIRRNKNPKLLAEKLKGLIPHRSFNVFFGKLCRSYKDGKMRAPKFKAELLHLAQTASFEERPKPAPKFIPLPWYEIEEMIQDETTAIIKSKGGERVIPKSTFLVTYLLGEYPGMMVGIMQYLNGKLSKEALIKNPYVRDRFVHYQPELIKNWNAELFEVCLYLLAEVNDCNPLCKVYKNEPAVKDWKVGMKLEMYFVDIFEYDQGRVVSMDKGVEIRYSDGVVYPLLAHQVKLNLWKKLV